MGLTDLRSPQEWADFEAELFERFNLNCTVYGTDGVGVTGKPNWCNALCPEIKGNPTSLATICAAGNQYFMATARKTGAAVIEACDAGLLKIAVPIIADGAFLGTAGGCGRLPEGGEVDAFLIEKTTGLSETAIASLCEGLAPMTESEARAAADYIARRLDELVETAG